MVYSPMGLPSFLGSDTASITPVSGSTPAERRDREVRRTYGLICLWICSRAFLRFTQCECVCVSTP